MHTFWVNILLILIGFIYYTYCTVGNFKFMDIDLIGTIVHYRNVVNSIFKGPFTLSDCESDVTSN